MPSQNSTVDDERSRKHKISSINLLHQDNMKFLTIPALARLTTYVHNQHTTLNVYTQKFTLSLFRIRKVHISTIETRTEYCKIVWLDQTWEGQIEAYSCKAAGDDKKLRKRLRRQCSEVRFFYSLCFFRYFDSNPFKHTHTHTECGETDRNS